MAQSENAYLDIRRSTEPGRIWLRVPLTDAETHLGRPEAGEPGVNLEYPWVSRRHACVERQELEGTTVYILRNIAGRAGIRLYAHLLKPGDSQPLLHCYTFQIPGVIEQQSDLHFLITLCVGNRTSYLAITRAQRPYFIIFGQLVELKHQEYTLLEYLYERKNEICPYAEIMADLWAEPRTSKQVQADIERLYNDLTEFKFRKSSLEILLSKVRDKIRVASGGVELIETIHGEGLCLRTCCGSGFCRDLPGLC